MEEEQVVMGAFVRAISRLLRWHSLHLGWESWDGDRQSSIDKVGSRELKLSF